VGAVDEGLGKIELASISKILSQVLEDLVEHSFSLPFLKPTVDRLIRRIASRQIRPRSSGP